MQEQRYDGTELLTESATPEKVNEAINNPQNKTVAVHRPGEEFTTLDGTQYRVGPAGNLVRISPKVYRRKRASYTHPKTEKGVSHG